MSSWKDVCRDKNGSDVCDTADACQRCIEQAARQMTDRLLSSAKEEQKDE